MTNAVQPIRLGLEPATIDMRAMTPRAPDYDDVYFSTDGGLAESRHVFIDGNNLRDRLSAWHDQRPFVIGETGFGTGRNLLVAWQTFEALAPPTARLHVVSFERHPLRATDLDSIWAADPEFSRHAKRLVTLWPAPMRGSQRLHLSDRVTLDLILDDIEPGLSRFDGRVDAWFLDGFAPARNPAMWSPRVFHELASASRHGATFATYSCARMVRDHASVAGFVWHKRRGYGRKRHMLCGQLDKDATAIAPKRQNSPWYRPPAVANSGPIAIIGAGIAGATMAEALARRGLACDIYDPHGGPGGASANAQAALYIRPAVNGDKRTRFYLAALQYSRRWLAGFDPERRLWSDCGLLQLACNDREAERQQRCVEQLGLPATVAQHIDAATATGLAGMPLANSVRGGLFYPHAGWVRPAALCRALLAASDATLHATKVVSLQQHGDCWRLFCDNGHMADYGHVVFACAHDAAQLCPDLPPLLPVRGQISSFEYTDTLPTPACVVCGHGQVMPPDGNRLHVGASFEADTDDPAPRPAEDRANVERLAEIATQLASQLVNQLAPAVASRVAFRCTGHDRLPYIGPLPDTLAWRRDYAMLALDARRIATTSGTYRTGLWASLAHGASGMVSAPLAAEMLASRMLGEPAPLPLDEIDAVHPGRWLIRQLQRGQ